MDLETLTLLTRDGVALLTVNRPQKLNAFTGRIEQVTLSPGLVSAAKASPKLPAGCRSSG